MCGHTLYLGHLPYQTINFHHREQLISGQKVLDSTIRHQQQRGIGIARNKAQAVSLDECHAMIKLPMFAETSPRAWYTAPTVSVVPAAATLSSSVVDKQEARYKETRIVLTANVINNGGRCILF